MKIIHTLFIITLLLCKPANAQVNPNSTASTQSVLSFINSLGSSCNVIYSQDLGHGNSVVSNFNPLVSTLENQTGHWLKMIGGDYGLDSNINIQSFNQVFKDYWASGRYVTLSWHPDNPWTGNDSWDTTNQNVKSQLITPGNAAYNTWRAELKKIADALEDLRDAGVVVLWRPFHEANGSWFWWGHPTNSTSNTDYIALWKDMFDYFTLDRGLNNLLWVFSAGESWNNPTNFNYPGNDYVDIVGLDIYQTNMSWVNPSDFNNLINTGKPFSITEFGPAIPNVNGDYDFNVVHDFIKNNYPEVTFIHVWHSWTGHFNTLIENRNASSILNDPCHVSGNNPLSVPNYEQVKVRFFPNPASHWLEIKHNFNHSVLELIDTQGRKILQYDINSKRTKVSLKTIPNGLYFVRLIENNSDKKYISRLIVDK